MLKLKDEYLIYYRSHVFSPIPITTPIELVIPNPPPVQEWVEFYPNPIYTHPLFGVL